MADLPCYLLLENIDFGDLFDICFWPQPQWLKVFTSPDLSLTHRHYWNFCFLHNIVVTKLKETPPCEILLKISSSLVHLWQRGKTLFHNVLAALFCLFLISGTLVGFPTPTPNYLQVPLHLLFSPCLCLAFHFLSFSLREREKYI